nr:hypothetical protein [uncultured Haemophilus sp.]
MKKETRSAIFHSKNATKEKPSQWLGLRGGKQLLAVTAYQKDFVPFEEKGLLKGIVILLLFT